MPVMTKMRDSMPVVFAVLAGIFLLMIIFQWGGQGTIFQQRGGERGVLGTVNGYPITQQDYNKIYEAVAAQIKDKNKEANLTEEDEDNANNQAWDQAVSEAIINQSIKQMGLVATEDEIREMVFNNPPPDVRKVFTDSLGNFNQQAYIKELRNPRNDSIVRLMEVDAKDQILQMKWRQAMAATVRITDSEAYNRYLIDSAKAMVQVVKLVAQPNPMQANQVSDKDIQAYYDSHQFLYHQDEHRKFQFVAFPLTPNNRDTALAMETAKSIESRLASAPLSDVDTVAKELAQDYSDLPYQPRHVVTMRELGNDTSLMPTKAGDVAVTNIQGHLTPLRVLEVFDTVGGVLVHTRHIEFHIYGPDSTKAHQRDSAMALANVTLAKLKAGADFAELARTISVDPRSAGKGGDLGWQDINQFPPVYADKLLAASPGEIIGPIESQGLLDIVQVLQKTKKAWAVVGVPLQIKASHQTLQLQEQMANLFRDHAKKDGFEKTAAQSGYRVITDAPAVGRSDNPIFNSPMFVDWLFQASQGDVSQSFDLHRNKAIVVAQLTKVEPDGPKPLEDVKNQIAQDLELRKAVAALAPRAEQVEAAVRASGDLSSAPASLHDSSLAPLSLTMGPAESVAGLPASEYVVNNWAYSAQSGAISPPLKGVHGYYVVKLIGRTVPPYQQFTAARQKVITQLTQESENRILTDWVEAEKHHATIEDYRIKQ